MTRRVVRRGLAALSSVLVGLLVAGCAASQSGVALPNDKDAKHYQAVRFVADLQKVITYFRDPRDIKGTVFSFASFEGKKVRGEDDIFMRGDPPAILVRTRSGVDGDNIDTYHLAGSDRDLILLGKRYRSLAPTEWVSHPTFYPRQGFYVCLISGVQTGCKMVDAIAKTQDKKPDGLLEKYTRHPDGRVELLTGVTLKAFLGAGVLIMPPVLRAKVTDEMLKKFIPVRVWFNADGSLDKFEMNGVVPGGPSPLEIQIGFDITGKTTAADFPPQPSPTDVTRLDRNQTNALYDKIGKLKGVS